MNSNRTSKPAWHVPASAERADRQPDLTSGAMMASIYRLAVFGNAVEGSVN